MRKYNYLMVLRDYCTKRQGAILSVIERDIFQVNGTDLHTMNFGYEADISNM